MGRLARECGFACAAGVQLGMRLQPNLQLRGGLSRGDCPCSPLLRFHLHPSCCRPFQWPLAFPVSLGAPWRRLLRHVLPSGFAWNSLLRWPFLCQLSALFPDLRSWAPCHRPWALRYRPKVSCGPPFPFNTPLWGVLCTKMTISCEFSPQLSEFHPNFATFVHKNCYQG